MRLIWFAPAVVAVVGSALLAATAAETARQARSTVADLTAATTRLRETMGQVRASVHLARSRALHLRPVTRQPAAARSGGHKRRR